jgi:hypothetical protein
MGWLIPLATSYERVTCRTFKSQYLGYNESFLSHVDEVDFKQFFNFFAVLHLDLYIWVFSSLPGILEFSLNFDT